MLIYIYTKKSESNKQGDTIVTARGRPSGTATTMMVMALITNRTMSVGAFVFNLWP